MEQADRIVVHKRQRQMLLVRGNAILRSYPIALGPNPAGHKQRQGDGRTPEGVYHVDWRNPNSAFHRSLHISYPDDADRSRSKEAGQDPGGEIMIHGQPNDGRRPSGDWTRGCIAVTDAEMDEIWELVPDGTAVEIRP